MKKMLYAAAIASAALASCSSDEFVGTAPSGSESTSTEAILFQGFSQRATRAADKTGAEAAALLNNKFTVLGNLVTLDNTVETVFDNYKVLYDGNVGGDESNEYGWSYLTTPGQELKYWNLAAKRYEFIAMSGYDETKRIASTEKNVLENLTANSVKDLYVSDKVTASYTGADGIMYGNKVGFTFKNMGAKVRLGLYETVPGYAVSNVRFYYGATSLTTNTNLATTTVGVNGEFPQKANYDISYDTKNSAMANLVASSATLDGTMQFGALKYQSIAASNGEMLKADGSSDATGEAAFLGTNSTEVTWAEIAADQIWQTILPNAANKKNIVLRVDYDLVPLDGGATPGSIIHVYNAAAVIPSTWAQWKPNYAYTYIFKISDQTSGQTIPPYIDPNKDTDGDGIPDYLDPDDDNDGIPDEEDPDWDPATPEDPDLPQVPDPDTENPNPNKPAVSPIVFDATVSAIENYNQETITGVTALGGDAITTYSKESNVTDASEYKVGETITLSSYSHGRWGVVHTTTKTTEKAVADNNTFAYDFIAGVPAAGQTIDEVSTYGAEFKVEQAGWYIVWLRYLPTGMADIDANYVDVFKVIETHE